MVKKSTIPNILQSWNLRYRRFQENRSPQMNLVWGFFLYAFFGFAFLSLPFLHKVDIAWLDSLFISVSAVSTTGLVTISVFDSFNLGGQLVILFLFQLGGIGYMTLTTYYLLFTTRRITRWHREIIGAEFTLPETIRINDFIKSVIIYTLVMEILGALAFFFAFSQAGMEGGQALWFSVFHSVSAFCTAGFGLFNDSFEQFADIPAFNIIISVLAIAGSLGFMIITDLWYRVTGKSKELSFTTKIIFYGFILLLGFGTLLFYLSEPLMQSNGQGSWMKAFFQSMTAMTTVGFNTVSTGEVSRASLLLIIFLMYVGASPSGTAGGLKITTLTAMLSILKSRLSGEKRISFLGKTIPFERLFVATSTFILYTGLIFLFTLLLSFSEKFTLEEILFEVASSLGTVGLSTGITGQLSAVGKLFLIVLMFVGRVGVLTFGFALLERKGAGRQQFPEDDLAV